MMNQPMAEVFGFRIDDLSDVAMRHRRHRLCPFNNKVPTCTKDKAEDPLGVCSVYTGDHVTVTCPIRFRHAWRRKMAVAVDRTFFATLPDLPSVPAEQADVAWLVYELVLDPTTNRYRLHHAETISTQFTPALLRITSPEPGSEGEFRALLQRKLRERQQQVSLPFRSLSVQDLFVGETDDTGDEEDSDAQ